MISDYFLGDKITVRLDGEVITGKVVATVSEKVLVEYIGGKFDGEFQWITFKKEILDAKDSD